MDEKELIEACFTCLNWINVERISKNKETMSIKLAGEDGPSYELYCKGYTIITSLNVKNFFYKLIGIARFLQFENQA